MESCCARNSGDYPRISEDLPDYNPRGCQKGACFVEYVYGARVEVPIDRGESVARKWKRATWDEALALIADKLLDNVPVRPDRIHFHSHPCHVAGLLAEEHDGPFPWRRHVLVLRLVPRSAAGRTDHVGVRTEACECADWFNAKYIVLWGSNINATRIPDAHFAWEARYNGAKVVCISPDYNCSAIHSDLYLQIAPGSDAVLALAVARYMLENNLHDVPYVKEQTDLGFLVRKDNGRFLRASDLVAGGKEDQFFIWDTATNRKARTRMPGSSEKTLHSALDPALEGNWSVIDVDGKSVR
jgi:complex iron-sulfur molybdoenzyme family reductase subunit alpha